MFMRSLRTNSAWDWFSDKGNRRFEFSDYALAVIALELIAINAWCAWIARPRESLDAVEAKLQGPRPGN